MEAFVAGAAPSFLGEESADSLPFGFGAAPSISGEEAADVGGSGGGGFYVSSFVLKACFSSVE